VALESGSRIGDYLLGDKLGQGGYGIVYSARDTKLDREIAVKVLKSDQVARPQVVARFLQEARSAAKIVHPGIVTVFECGEVTAAEGEAGNVFIAMEMLVGEPLGKRLKRDRVSTALAMEIAIQVASALEAAHAKGIVHRDLKPDNLFLVDDASLACGVRVKVLDFGIAKLADADDITNIHTSSMMMMGTPKYMSPEQCRSTAAVDHRTDIYSLGCILFEMLTARTPFVGDAGEQIAKHQLEATPSMRALVPEVPKALDKLVVKMLAKRPENRPATMAKVQEALEVLTGPRPESVIETGPTDAVGRGPDRLATVADLPSAKVARSLQGLRELPVLAGENTDVNEALTTRQVAGSKQPDPRSSTNPERSATQAPSLELLHPRWWLRSEVLIGAGALVVVAIVIGLAKGRGSGHGEVFMSPASTPEPARSAPPATAEAPVPEAPVVPTVMAASCDPKVTARAWDELLACADQVTDREASRALHAQAVLETRNRDSLAKLVQALARKDPAEALVWLDRVDDGSVYRAEAIEMFAKGLPGPEAALPGCNASVHTTAAKAKLGVGQYREALREIELSLRCRTDPSLYRLGALAACNGRNLVKARMFAAKLPAGQRTTIRQICLRNGVSLP